MGCRGPEVQILSPRRGRFGMYLLPRDPPRNHEIVGPSLMEILDRRHLAAAIVVGVPSVAPIGEPSVTVKGPVRLNACASKDRDPTVSATVAELAENFT